MALINCRECGKPISDTAVKCPHCGCPVNGNKNETLTSVSEETENRVQSILEGKRKYLPEDKLNEIRKQLYALNPEQLDAIEYSFEFENPTTMLVISLFFGGMGFDRFILGDNKNGAFKWILNCVIVGCVWWLIDLFKIKGLTRDYNYEQLLTATKWMARSQRATIQQRKSKKSMWVTIGVVLVFVSIMLQIVARCAGGGNTETASTQSLEQSLQNVTTVEEAERLIDNTTWHYTADTSSDDIGFWVKVTFKNGRYTSYYANPSDGRWTQQGEGAYEIKEDRYSNTGEKYISVHWDGGGYNGFPCKYALVLNNFQFAVTSAVPAINPYSYSHRFETPSPDYGFMELGDYEWN
ncbi:MAG: TM2 domain-containing protein [Prevotellaceae bacterium]|nr:TM2 domain-containing protein [Prevotellaceae bacterium]